MFNVICDTTTGGNHMLVKQTLVLCTQACSEQTLVRTYSTQINENEKINGSRTKRAKFRRTNRVQPRDSRGR